MYLLFQSVGQWLRNQENQVLLCCIYPLCVMTVIAQFQAEDAIVYNYLGLQITSLQKVNIIISVSGILLCYGCSRRERYCFVFPS